MEILGGPYFGVAGAGESHGPGVTTIVMGAPAGIYLTREEIQRDLDRRRPGGNKHGTPRNEKDKIVLLSGLYQTDHDQLTSGPPMTTSVDDQEFSTTTYESGWTTGEPIAALVLSTSKKSGDYQQFSGAEGEVRPGHTDLVKHFKSRGFVDFRGGGRSSYRSTISDVIAGAVARACLRQQFKTEILSSICQVGPLVAQLRLSNLLEPQGRSAGASGPNDSPDLSQLQRQMAAEEIYTVDGPFAHQAADLIKSTRLAGDSIGAAVEVVAVHVPPLLGEPLYNSLKLRLMGSLGGLHAVQACEIGAGGAVVERTGSENNDPIRRSGYQTNRHGGLIGGITTGNPLVMRVSFKPTSTIHSPQPSVRKDLSEVEFQLAGGRHDPCVGVRAGVTLESRVAIELLNAVLAHQAQRIHAEDFKLF